MDAETVWTAADDAILAGDLTALGAPYVRPACPGPFEPGPAGKPYSRTEAALAFIAVTTIVMGLFLVGIAALELAWATIRGYLE